MAAITKVITEDFGKIFEKAICILYETQYDGKFKYSENEAHSMQERIRKIKSMFPYNIVHTAKGGSKYDFTSQEVRLSAKTSKNSKTGKVCPQVIGQPSKKKFCEYFNLEHSITHNEIKYYIQQDIHSILEIYCKNTFDCPIIYFNKKTDNLLVVEPIVDINWSEYNIVFSHIKKNKEWRESSTISINNTTIGEFQIHNNRDCIKFRWCFEPFLATFGKAFLVSVL